MHHAVLWNTLEKCPYASFRWLFRWISWATWNWNVESIRHFLLTIKVGRENGIFKTARYSFDKYLQYTVIYIWCDLSLSLLFEIEQICIKTIKNANTHLYQTKGCIIFILTSHTWAFKHVLQGHNTCLPRWWLIDTLTYWSYQWLNYDCLCVCYFVMSV